MLLLETATCRLPRSIFWLCVHGGDQGVRLALEVFNLLDSKDSDIDYFYTSRLPGEAIGGIGDVHFHPTLPRTARISLIVGR